MLPIGKLCLTSLLTLLWTSRSEQSDDLASPARIAIVGGGIGGTSAAYFLQELFGDDAIIDLYESRKIGGRLATVGIAGREYEVGGSIIHPRNQYMLDFVSRFGLSQKKFCAENVGLFNGKEYVYRSGSWVYLDLAKLLWRYGWDIFRLNEEGEVLFNSFDRIYTLQAEGHAYPDVSSMLYSMDPMFLKMTQSSAGEWLKSRGLHNLTIQELVTAAVQNNYGQTPDVNAFVGAVAVVAADPNIWAVFGGNKQVAEELLKHSRASLLRRFVTQIAHHSQGHFVVTSREIETPEGEPQFSEGSSSYLPEVDLSHEPRSQEYDIVIIATPLTNDKSNISFVNFTKDFYTPGHYERIFCTIVNGKLRPESILLPDDDHIDHVLVTNPNLIFNSIGKATPVDYNECSQDTPPVWKFFSASPLGENQLNIFFENRNSTNVIDWLAYPHYEPGQKLADFELMPGLYHVNSIEVAGSAMEMSVIGAKNVALLAYKYWLKDPNAGKKMPVRDEL